MVAPDTAAVAQAPVPVAIDTVAAIAPPEPPEPPPVVPPPRALWVVRHDLADPRALAGAIDWAARAGFTDLLLQVRGRGDAYYRSQLAPRAEELGRGGDPVRDPLAEALAAAHARGLRVHAWINVFLGWSGPERPLSPEHVARRHRDWFVWIAGGRRAPRSTLDLARRDLDRLGLEGHFLAPGNPEVGAHLEAVVRELAGGYALDGLHLDYARLPLLVTSFDPASRVAFRTAHGGDPLALLDRRARERLGEAETERLAAAWQEWNEEQVTAVVARLARAARAVRPGITVSAAVYPDPARARRERGQAGVAWLDSGLIDLAIPMCYAPDPAVVRADMEAARGATRGRLWAGLGLYNKPLARALEGVVAAHELGYDGVALFSHGAAREAGHDSRPAIASALAAFAGTVGR